MQININHEALLVPKDRSRKPFKCFGGYYYDGQLKNDKAQGWCGTCDYKAKRNS